MLENIKAPHIWAKELAFKLYIKNAYETIINRKQQNRIKGAENKNQHFTKEETLLTSSQGNAC